MAWEVVFAIISLIISIFSLLFFSLYPSIKKSLINKTFIRIENFYNIYSYLNPCFLNRSDETKRITEQLIHQNFLCMGFPKFKFLISKGIKNFDQFALQSSLWADKLTLKEIIDFYNFWKLANKKIAYIKDIIDRYDYIVYKGFYKTGIKYRSSSNAEINKSSISLCPSFDNLKLYKFLIPLKANDEEKKLPLKNIEGNEKNKHFLNELKSNNFAINLRFENNFASNIYSYSIIFENGNIVEVEAFFQKRIIELNDLIKQEINNQFKWINETFNIDTLSLIKEWPQWIKNLKM